MSLSSNREPLFELLLAQVQYQPKHLALVQGEKSLSYRELWQHILNFTDWLRSKGVKEGQRIGLVFHNDLPHVVAALGIMVQGATLVPIPPEVTLHERKIFEDTCNIEAILSGEKGSLPQSINKPITNHSQEVLNPLISKAVIIRPTSGTTGRMKGVILSQRSILGRLKAADAVLKVGPEDVIWWCLSCAYHFAVSVFLFLSKGATIVLAEDNSFNTWQEALARHPISILYASPYLYRLWLTGTREVKLNHLRWVLCTGAPLPFEMARKFKERFGHPLRQAYGLIEAGLVAINSAQPPHPEESVGEIVPGYAIKVVDDSGKEVGPGEIGEIFIRGPGMFEGYVNSKEKFGPERWFATGDLGKLEGRVLSLHGRKGDMLNVVGYKVSCEEIEWVLSQHPGVKQVRVYGVPSEAMGHLIRAELVLAQDKAVSSAELRTFCSKYLAPYKIPIAFDVVDHIPITPSGKIKRKIFPYSAEKLVSHRPPMLLVDKVWDRRLDMGVVESKRPKDTPFYHNGRLEESFLVELLAQAAAAIDGYDAMMADKPLRTGFLVGLEEFLFFSPPKPEDTIWIKLEKTFEFGQLHIIKGELRQQEVLLAEGELKIWTEEL